jgi:hypothetical protein
MTRTTSDDSVGEWAGQLCRDFAFLYARAARAGAQPKRHLDELTAAVQAGRADARWTARLIELLRSLGIPAAEADRGWTLHIGGPGELVPAGAGVASVDLHRCPHGVCARRELRRPGAPVPSCGLFDEPLTVEGSA